MSVHEGSEQKERYANEQRDVGKVVREHLYIDEIDDTPIEPPIPAEHPVDEVPKGSTENETEGDSLDPARCVTEYNHDHDDDTDRNNGEDRTLVGKEREASARIEGQPEHQDVLDNDDRCIREGVDGPCLGQLVNRCDNDSNNNSKLSVAQPLWAAPTVVVAYGIASNLATGIGSPVTSHIP